MERSTILNGKIHELSMVIFNSYVKLPEGNKEHDFQWIGLREKFTGLSPIFNGKITLVSG